MLTSLLSLYIASVLGVTLEPAQTSGNSNSSLVRTASASISDLLESDQKPIKDSIHISPIIQATGSIATDLETGEILYEKASHTRLKMASITKLMTILIILEENGMEEVVEVSNNAAQVEGSTMRLRAGEQITIENLLYGALISSANDAAVALAEYNAGTVDRFVEKMNNKGTELGLVNTHFSNPIGLDQSNNYSSAYDISRLANYLYHNKFVKKAAKIKNLEVYSTSGKYTHKLESTNQLLDSYLKINGLKTGKTDAAGLCLVAIAENREGHEIITVVLDSPARFEESKILIDWIFRSYAWP